MRSKKVGESVPLGWLARGGALSPSHRGIPTHNSSLPSSPSCVSFAAASPSSPSPLPLLDAPQASLLTRAVVRPPEVPPTLQSFRRRDLLASHAHRVERAAREGRVSAAEAGIAKEVVRWQLAKRRELAESEAEARRLHASLHSRDPGSGARPRPASAAGFVHYVPETEAEAEMNVLWQERRRAEVVRDRNQALLGVAMSEWAARKNRMEEEIARRIEARRRPTSALEGTSGLFARRPIRSSFAPAPTVAPSASLARDLAAIDVFSSDEDDEDSSDRAAKGKGGPERRPMRRSAGAGDGDGTIATIQDYDDIPVDDSVSVSTGRGRPPSAGLRGGVLGGERGAGVAGASRAGAEWAAAAGAGDAPPGRPWSATSRATDVTTATGGRPISAARRRLETPVILPSSAALAVAPTATAGVKSVAGSSSSASSASSAPRWVPAGIRTSTMGGAPSSSTTASSAADSSGGAGASAPPGVRPSSARAESEAILQAFRRRGLEMQLPAAESIERALETPGGDRELRRDLWSAFAAGHGDPREKVLELLGPPPPPSAARRPQSARPVLESATPKAAPTPSRPGSAKAAASAGGKSAGASGKRSPSPPKARPVPAAVKEEEELLEDDEDGFAGGEAGSGLSASLPGVHRPLMNARPGPALQSRPAPPASGFGPPERVRAFVGSLGLGVRVPGSDLPAHPLPDLRDELMGKKKKPATGKKGKKKKGAKAK